MKNFLIIIVNYNCSNDTIEVIQSLQKFNRNIFDISLVDNASSIDDFSNLKNNLSTDINLIRSETNLGFAGGNNLSINQNVNKGYKYFFLLNPDTIIDDLHFFELIEENINKENADIIGPLIKYYPKKDTIYFAGGDINKYTGLTKMLGKGQIDTGQYTDNTKCDFITGCAMIVKKEVIKKIGGLPEDYFLYFEESDYCLTAKKAGYNIVFTPKTYVYHKVSTSIGYISNIYLYYMIRNFRIFSKKFVKKRYLPLFYLYYLFVWVPGYSFLAIKNGNCSGIKYIVKGFLNIKYK